ncbi:hypothetical protein DL95DRAFT_388031, partial [Leptodontidium sp. 2 PMI_412]
MTQKRNEMVPHAKQKLHHMPIKHSVSGIVALFLRSSSAMVSLGFSLSSLLDSRERADRICNSRIQSLLILFNSSLSIPQFLLVCLESRLLLSISTFPLNENLSSLRQDSFPTAQLLFSLHSSLFFFLHSAFSGLYVPLALVHLLFTDLNEVLAFREFAGLKAIPFWKTSF